MSGFLFVLFLDPRCSIHRHPGTTSLAIPVEGAASVGAQPALDDLATGEASIMEFPNRHAVETALLSSGSDRDLGVFCVRRGRNGGKVLSVVLQPQRVTHFSLSWVSV